MKHRTFPIEQGDPRAWLMRDAKSPFADHITGFLAAKTLASEIGRRAGRS